MRRWYLIQTKPCGELIAQSNLERQNYEVYLPRVLQPVRLQGQWRGRIVALFPRYMFLCLDEGRESLAPVRSTVGVASVVHFGSNYALVPDAVIRDLRARADPDSGLHRLNRPPLFTKGAAVRLAVYPFGGLEGVFECLVGAERAVVLLRLLGHDARVRVPAGLLIPRHAA